VAKERACARFVRLIEAGDYFDAHEALEAVWFPQRHTKAPEVRLQRGLINGAVALELAKRGRLEPAKRVWRVYLRRRALLEEVKSAALPCYHKADRLLRDLAKKALGA